MFFQDRKIKYSIRKLSVATVSLAIGFLFAPAALGVAQVAQADELSTTEQVENKAENQVSVVSFATEQEESETTYVDTTNKVTWTFAGYDKEKIVVGKGRQTFLGSWVPTPNPEYVFKSSKAGVPLPQSILGMLPKDEASYKVGDTIVAKQPAVESVVEEEKDYVWTFKGYDQKNATYNGKRVTFTGIWEVTPRPHHASYTFVSVTSGVDLPKFIQKKAPKDGSTYFNRTRVFAEEPTTKTYIDSVNDGTWTFKGYDAASAVVNKANVEFVGKWEFKANPTNAETYTPQVTEETIKVGQTPDLTDNVTNLPNLPAGTKVVDITPAGQIDTTKPGTYTGKVRVDYPDGSSTEVSVSVNVLPAPETQTYKVTYRFESATSDKALPAGIATLLPSDSATYENGNSVSAKQPAQATYIDSVNDGTWTFKGYDAASAVVNKANVEFVGKWTFEANKYQATYRFESATSDKALPAGIATLLPSDSATYENGNSVSAKQPAQATYIDSVNDGTWTFKGYDAASAVVNKANVEFVGKWEFKANPTNAETYTPQVTEETIKVGQTPDLTDNVTNLPNLPAGTKVVDITPAGQIDTTKPGTYTGKVRVDYPDGSSTEVSVSVNVLPAPETQTYKVTYRFESATSDKALPAGIATLLPSDSATYENGNSVSAKQPAQATYIDSVNDGTWTFKGYDAASAVVNKANVEFVGKWEFKANPTNAETYTPQVTEETIKVGQTPDLTDNVTNLPNLPAGTKVVDITPAGQIDTTKPGTYTGKVRVDYPDGSSTEVSVSVNVLPAPETQTYKVTYRFESATSDKALPAGIATLLPSDSATYENGNSVSAKQPAQATYIDSVNDGTWTFKGYDAASAVVNKANVEFVGKWEFKVNPTNAETYTPQVTEETIKVGQTPDLTDNVTNLPNLPAGTKVVDITPAGQIDTTKPGTYTGKVRVDYPDGSSTEVSVSVNVLPAPETQTYKVTYRFESATADNNLPAEVLSLLPQSGTYTTSSSVAIAFVPEAPMPVEVAVANGTWTFLGYQEVEEGSNLTFVGKWVFEAKQDPSPQPQPAPTPQPAPQPNPVPPVNPGGEQGTDNNQADRHQSEQPRKPEENPPAQGPAGEKEKQATLPNAGSTAPLSLTGLVTSSLLAGLAVLLLGRKRKDD
ncbi:YSIRK-type signal peptide-containing protein [Streptococcus pneumoniae]|uniref:SHIRT domain-containing protein n=10 Tax=Streptococcus pneumoniae TaxID=1313 RepID=UPI001EE06169|nr:SHIRT domain-containing protein [Streptococcus pneumoniae]UKP72116.1 YSIRK-type signal peptide-containing protein [Streptococcus pneumoniae]UKP74132.1 YSIRK-type signal peptide-containing protein [Streptococcus pneumoniae]